MILNHFSIHTIWGAEYFGVRKTVFVSCATVTMTTLVALLFGFANYCEGCSCEFVSNCYVCYFDNVWQVIYCLSFLMQTLFFLQMDILRIWFTVVTVKAVSFMAKELSTVLTTPFSTELHDYLLLELLRNLLGGFNPHTVRLVWASNAGPRVIVKQLWTVRLFCEIFD